MDVLVCPVSRWPDPGELINVNDIVYCPGGTALNTAVTVEKLGVKDIYLSGFVGEDQAGKEILDYLQKSGVNCSGILQEAQQKTGTCIVNVHLDGERSFFYSPGANNLILDTEILIDQIQEGSIVHFGGILDMPLLSGGNLLDLARNLKKKGCFISGDIAWDWRSDGWSAIKDCLPFMDMLMMNQQEAEILFKSTTLQQISQKIRLNGCNTVIVKLGKGGAYIRTEKIEKVVPGFTVPVLDTTGAGDAFAGGLLVAYSKGCSPEKMVRFANAVGACCVQSLGATTGIRSFEETIQFMQDHI